jgi:hypothetical protein
MERGGRGWAVVWAAALLLAAFLLARRTTHDLAWPNEHDLYRDVAAAQSILDEGFGRDPYYRGELVWYNPLTSLAMAATHRITHVPLPEVAVRGGAYLNLLGPVAFFLMVWVMFDAWTAWLALGGFLFCIGGSFPSWASATYSPWLYPVNFAQAFFYLLIMRLVALRTTRLSVGWALGAGGLLGLLFLGHTAPTLLFGCIFAWVVGRPLVRKGHVAWSELRGLMGPAVAMMGAFLAITWPYTATLVGHYGLRIVNDVPNGYVADFLGYRKIPLMIARHLDLPVLIGWFGLFLVWRNREDVDPAARRILLPWLLVSAAGLFYGYVVAGAAKVGLSLPIIIPSYHCLFYFKAALSILFAIGLTALARRIAVRFAGEPVLARWSRHVSLLLLLATMAWTWPALRGRYDHRQARAEALGHGEERDRIAVYDWFRAHGRPADVVLASDDMGIFAVAPAGAKVVVVNPYFSNPYVDWVVRVEARDRMLELLARGMAEDFSRLADAWQVTYVVDESAGQRISPSLVGPLLEPVLASGPVRVYHVASR